MPVKSSEVIRQFVWIEWDFSLRFVVSVLHAGGVLFNLEISVPWLCSFWWSVARTSPLDCNLPMMKK